MRRTLRAKAMKPDKQRELDALRATQARRGMDRFGTGQGVGNRLAKLAVRAANRAPIRLTCERCGQSVARLYPNPSGIREKVCSKCEQRIRDERSGKRAADLRALLERKYGSG